MKLALTAAALRSSIERLHPADHAEVRVLLEQEARRLEEYQVEWDEMNEAPAWLPFVWDCVLFVTQGIIYAGFLIRAVIRPAASIHEAPAWALEARRRIEKSFIEEDDKHSRLRGGISHGFRKHTTIKPKD